MKINKQYIVATYSLAVLPVALAAGGYNGDAGLTVEVYNSQTEIPIKAIGEKYYGDPSGSQSELVKNANPISSINILIENKIIKGYQGNNGEDARNLNYPLGTNWSQYKGGAGGVGGMGGGAITGGVSIGGAGGGVTNGVAPGGAGGNINNNSISLKKLEVTGANGGSGGEGKNTDSGRLASGGGGAGGIGGGSVLGGVSIGGGGGVGDFFFSMSSGTQPAVIEVYDTNQQGGKGGDIFSNRISMSFVSLQGANGGDGGAKEDASNFGWGAAGLGGGSVIGGLSMGGSGGYGEAFTRAPSSGLEPSKSIISSISNGGAGGDIYQNTIYIDTVTIKGGQAGVNGNGTPSDSTLNGGSVFGGLSIGGAGGHALVNNMISIPVAIEASGGFGGNVEYNSINISGKSDIENSIYGGYSKGGSAGQITEDGVVRAGSMGYGGLTRFNTVTLVGDDLIIGGSLYGGLSVNGDGNRNIDSIYKKYYQGNTLNIRSGRIDVNGVFNFEKYNWLLPQNEFNQDVIITIASGGTPVELANTIHHVDVDAVGNTLHAGDKVYLIDNVTGNFDRQQSADYLEQGFFIIYDATLDVEKRTSANGVTTDALTLTVLGTNDGIPDGKINPEAEGFLKGRVAQLAIVDQGADMMSDGIWSARASLREENANLFIITEGGSNRYKTAGSGSLTLNDFKFAVGGAKALEFENKSVGMIGAFFEHGMGNYDGYSDLGSFGKVNGYGKLRYHGVGALFHVDFAGTDISKVEQKPNIFDSKYGLYVHGAMRVGHVNVDFHSSDMVNGKGLNAYYNTTSRYMSAMAGVGYVLTIDEKRAFDFYGRFTYSHLNGKGVEVIDESMSVGSAHSKRLRLGARYGYAYSSKVVPYVGMAYERNFAGDVSGSAYGFTIKEKSLKGNTGVLEVGLLIKPDGTNDPLSLHLGMQGYFGQRKGVTATLKARYVF